VRRARYGYGAGDHLGRDGGWAKQERFLAEYRAEDREELAQLLVDTPPRHITARGWTMPDGTRARIPFQQTVILQNQLLG